MRALGEDLRGGVVGEMPVAPGDARLQRRRIARRPASARIVVALEQQRRAAAQLLEQVGGDGAGIGQHAEAGGAVAAAQLQRFGRIVRHGVGQQAQRADGDRLAVAREVRFDAASSPPIARQVPRLVHSGGRPWRAPGPSAQPTWSPCSWVTNTASSAGRLQSGARQPRLELAQRETAVDHDRWTCRPSRASTTVALPPLPLPRLQKRIGAGRPYFSSSSSRPTMRWPFSPASGAPWALSTATGAAIAVALDLDAVAQRAAGGVGLAEQLGEAGLALADVLRVDIAHEVQALARSRSSTVKPPRSSARPTRRQARSKLSSTCSVDAWPATMRARASARRHVRHRGLGGFLGHAELLHQARQEGRFELRVGRRGCQTVESFCWLT